MKDIRQPQIIAGRVNADGTIAWGTGFTVQRPQAGVYNMTFPPSFKLVSITVNKIQTDTPHYWQSAGTGGNVASLVTVTSIGAAAADAAFFFTAVGQA